MAVILVLEDIETVRSVFTVILRRNGHLVLEAITAGEAAELVQKHGSIDLLIANVTLPGRCSGTRAALEISALLPGLKVLFTSASPVDRWTRSDFKDLQEFPVGSYSILAKPFTRTVLERKVGELLTKTRTASE